MEEQEWTGPFIRQPEGESTALGDLTGWNAFQAARDAEWQAVMEMCKQEHQREKERLERSVLVWRITAIAFAACSFVFSTALAAYALARML
jgi:hypothetical protein